MRYVIFIARWSDNCALISEGVFNHSEVVLERDDFTVRSVLIYQ
ncbi:MAG: hypothetical protein ACTS44_00065 [Candidatus Hodgkinia cicadicola]